MSALRIITGIEESRLVEILLLDFDVQPLKEDYAIFAGPFARRGKIRLGKVAPAKVVGKIFRNRSDIVSIWTILLGRCHGKGSRVLILGFW